MSKDNSYDKEFAKRIENVISKAGGPSEFAKKTGFSLPSLYRWQSGADPSRSNLIKIAETTGTDLLWLATGVGDADSQPQQNKNEINLLKEFENVAMLSSYEAVRVSAGFGSFNYGVTAADGEEPYSEHLLKVLGVKPKCAGVFWASGNSMEPTISNGDQLLVDFARKEPISSGKIYLVQNGASVWVKRVKMLWDSIELISDNAAEFEPIRIPHTEAENLQIIGQVVHIGKNMV